MIYFKFIIIILLFNFINLSVEFQRYSNKINIGYLCDSNCEENEIIFKTAIEEVNRDLETPIDGKLITVKKGNIYDTSQKLCNILQEGVGAIFGSLTKNAAVHVSNICDSKEIPFVDLRLNSELKANSIKLHITPDKIAEALHDLVAAYGWPSFTFLYESSEFINILNELMNCYSNNEMAPTITVRKYDLNLNGDFRSVLRRVRISKDNSIIIVGSIDTLPSLLAQAQQVGIITDQYKIIVCNLDFHTLYLDQYKYSEANITSFRLVSPENDKIKVYLNALGHDPSDIHRNVSCPITMDMALLTDGVQLFAETLKHFKIKPISLSCNGSNYWQYGYSINNFMSLSSLTGVSGNISFSLGSRNDFNLELIELTTHGVIKIGTWNTEKKVQYERQIVATPQLDRSDELSLVNKSFTVLTALTSPYGELKNSTVQLNGNDRYQGFGIELIQKLAEKLGFNYTFKIHPDGDYGSFNVQNNVSTGMMREVIEGRVDLAITDLTITAERQAGVDFTIPFMNLGISILYTKPEKKKARLLSFMDPFSGEVWLWLGFSYLGVSMSLFILGRLSPAEWDNPYPCIEEPTELENQFSFPNSMWFTIGALLQQGSEIAPKSPSTRTVASIWWFFTLIMVSSYTANLAAFLTSEQPTSAIDNIEDLANNKNDVQFGCKTTGSTRNFFMGQEDKIYKKINEYLEKQPNQLTNSNQEGVARVLDSHGKYAFLMESTSIEYNVARQCNFTQIGGLLDEKGYGIAMRKNWPYRDKLNYALLELQEAGDIIKLKNKWWNEVGSGGCGAKNDEGGASALGMSHLGGIYLVLLVGSVLASFFGIARWICGVRRNSMKLKIPFLEFFRQELKFIGDCGTNTKAVKTTESTYSRNSSLTLESLNSVTNEIKYN